MLEDSNENIKETIKDTQMLIRNQMNHHKKIAKNLHNHIKKDKKTIELYKEKIAKLTVEKEKLELKQNIKNDDTQPNNYEINHMKHLIMKEISEKNELEEKIREIKDDLLQLKQEMGGLNATQHQQERYEKHIKILENRLDKANQKFNESIEYDKKLRDDIDRLRKERFFFENIYKKLEKELEIIRKRISNNLEDAYDNYEQRDMNQEGFENLKAQMIKKESEYAKILSDIANDLNIRNSRKKSIEGKENFGRAYKGDDIDYNFKNYSKKLKSEQMEQQNENLQEKLQNLQFKFQKLEEFTEQKDVDSFCNKFKKNAQKNFDLFVVISSISKQAKQLESEIKEIEEEINGYKKFKNSKQGIEKNALINELKTRTQKLLHKQDKYENEYKKYNDEFKQIGKYIFNLYSVLECEANVDPNNKIQLESGVNETNVRVYLAEIESKLKLIQRYFEIERMGLEDDYPTKLKNTDKDKPTAKQISENMKNIFASMEISKIKTFDKIKHEHKPDEIKFDNIKLYSESIADELLDNLNRANLNEKKTVGKFTRKFKFSR